MDNKDNLFERPIQPVRKPKILRKLIFIDNQDIVDEQGLEYVKGQANIILSVLRTYFPNQVPFDSRDMLSALAKHPEFNCPRVGIRPNTQSVVSPAERAWGVYRWKFRKMGLLKELPNDDGRNNDTDKSE